MSTIDRFTRRQRRSAAAQREALTNDLSTYTSKADLAELAALLDRHSDADSAPLRDAVDWTRAA